MSSFGDGNGGAAYFNAPQGIAVDSVGNVYVGDTGNQRIRKITPAGDVTTLAGSGAVALVDGKGAGASFNYPQGVAVDTAGNVYVADTENDSVRKVTPSGDVTTLAGPSAGLQLPGGIALDATGNLVIAQGGDSRILSLTMGGVATAVAGSGQRKFEDGTGAAASFANPVAIAVRDKALYVADYGNYRIRRVGPLGQVTTLAGAGAPAFADGPGKLAGFSGPQGVAADGSGNVYVADGQRIRRITAAGVVSTLAGAGDPDQVDGAGPVARFNIPYALALHGADTIYVADFGAHRIRKIVSVGIGQATVSWKPPTLSGTSPIRGYKATATATGEVARTCSTSGGLACTIEGLTSGIAYTVSVTATNASGAGKSLGVAVATPN